MGIALVALADILQHVSVIHLLAPPRQFQRPPVGAGFGAGGDEDLHLCVRADHGADVAPIQHRSFRAAGEAPLHVEQGLAHGGDGGDHRGGLAHLAPAQLFLIEIHEGKAARRLHGPAFVVEPLARLHQRPRRGPVEQAGVEMRQAEVLRQPTRQRALARRCGTIECNDHGLTRRSRPAVPWPGGRWGSWWRSYWRRRW